MSGLAAQFGPALLVTALAAPLVVLAIFLAPGSRGFARAITPLAAAPALAAAVLAIGGAPFGVELPALRMSLSLDQPGGLLLLVAALVWLIVSIFALMEGPVAALAERRDAVNDRVYNVEFDGIAIFSRGRAGEAERRPVRGVLAAHDGRQSRRVHRR